MRNIVIFIRVYFTFFFFLVLMAVSLYMLFSFNKFHHAVYSEAANEVSGSISTQFNKVSYYFYLKRTNDSLVRANEILYNKLRSDFSIPDTADQIVVDTLKTDSLNRYRRFLYMAAKVVKNSVSQPNNYIVVHRGRKEGVSPDLGVLGPNGAVVGTVIDVSDNFSIVMSLLHSQSNTSARLKKGGETGNLVWDGIDRHILILKDISKSAKINQGDTVITSGFSDKFPEGIILGYVKDIINDPGSSTYTIRVNSAANFETLQFAYIIENLQKGEIDQLFKKVKSK